MVTMVYLNRMTNCFSIRVIIFVVLSKSFVFPNFLLSQKIEIEQQGVRINTISIKSENDIKRALGSPEMVKTFPDSIKGGYWEYPDFGITVYFTNKQNIKTCDLSINCKSFTGELFLGKSKIDRDTHIYKLLQFEELQFKPIEIEPIPEDSNKFMQLIESICFGRNISFIYDRLDYIGLISIDMY